METLIIQGIPVDSFMENLSALIASKVEESVRKIKIEELQDRFISPKETCQLFSPAISLVSLAAWTKAGRLKKYTISGRCYYSYGEVIEAIKGSVLKKYMRTA